MLQGTRRLVDTGIAKSATTRSLWKVLMQDVLAYLGCLLRERESSDVEGGVGLLEEIAHCIVSLKPADWRTGAWSGRVAHAAMCETRAQAIEWVRLKCYQSGDSDMELMKSLERVDSSFRCILHAHSCHFGF